MPLAPSITFIERTVPETVQGRKNPLSVYEGRVGALPEPVYVIHQVGIG